MAIVTASKLRAIADRLERDAAREVAELRRMADLMDGAARVTRARAKPKARAGAKTKAKRAMAQKKAARNPARKPTQRAVGRGR